MKKNLTFLLTFCFAKGTVFLVPILLADVLTSEDFGLLEYALAGVGMLLNALINLGIPAAYPYFILRKKELSIRSGFFIHPVWLVLYFAINQLLYFIIGLYGIEIYMAINISFIIANQLFYSVQFKSHERIKLAVLLDAGIYFLLGFYLIGSILGMVSLSIENLSLGILLYALLYVVLSLFNLFRSYNENSVNNYKRIINFSIHLLISSVFLFALTVSGRVLAKHFFGYDEAGLYGFYYRLAAIVVMIYQVISIRYFKDLYTMDLKVLDLWFSRFFAFIFVISIAGYFISPYLVPYFSDYFLTTFEDNKILFLIIFSQMTMWIATALNSSIVDREGLAKICNRYFLILFIVFVGILFGLESLITLDIMSFIIYTIFFFTTLLQYLTLSKKKIFFKRSGIALTGIYLSSCIVLYFMM